MSWLGRCKISGGSFLEAFRKVKEDQLFCQVAFRDILFYNSFIIKQF